MPSMLCPWLTTDEPLGQTKKIFRSTKSPLHFFEVPNFFFLVWLWLQTKHHTLGSGSSNIDFLLTRDVAAALLRYYMLSYLSVLQPKSISLTIFKILIALICTLSDIFSFCKRYTDMTYDDGAAKFAGCTVRQAVPCAIIARQFGLIHFQNTQCIKSSRAQQVPSQSRHLLCRRNNCLMAT